jgi:hypothetical protein
MTTYQAALYKLNKAKTLKELKRLDKSFERIYNNGLFTVIQYQTLDQKLVDKLIQLEG